MSGPAESGNETARARLREAAILLLAMGEDEAAKVLKLLDPREVQRVGAAMAALGKVHSRQVDRVVNRFLETVSGEQGEAMGANDYLKSMLVGALGERRAQPRRALTRRVRSARGRADGSQRGLDALRWMNTGAVADFLLHEPVRVRAIVLSYLSPERAAQVVELVPGDRVKVDLVMELADLEPAYPRGLEDLSPARPRRASRHSGAGPAPLGGPQAAAALVGRLEENTRRAVMGEIQRRDQALAERMLELLSAPGDVGLRS